MNNSNILHLRVLIHSLGATIIPKDYHDPHVLFFIMYVRTYVVVRVCFDYDRE